MLKGDIATDSPAKRLAPIGYFAIGVASAEIAGIGSALVLANGSDWTPQPVTLHFTSEDGLWHEGPAWFSDDYDHHMAVAVGDLSGNGFDDVVVSVICGKDREFSGGGVKVYLGGPKGLARTPVWLSRGFGACGLALGDTTGTGTLDVLVSCLWEKGSVDAPNPDVCEPSGRARLLINSTTSPDELTVTEVALSRQETRGCGAVALADVNKNGTLDAIFGGSRTSILFGALSDSALTSWEAAVSWSSTEKHPFCFSLATLSHPTHPQGLLVASSRGLFSMVQLQGESLSSIQPGVLIHAPTAGDHKSKEALQFITSSEGEQVQVPAGLAYFTASDGTSRLAVGYLDASGKTQNGASVRIYREDTDEKALFEQTGIALPGARLMSGHLHVTTSNQDRTLQTERLDQVTHENCRVLTVKNPPAGRISTAEVLRRDGSKRRYARSDSEFLITQTSDRGSIAFSPPLRRGDKVTLKVASSPRRALIATSAAAWPPVGATGAWQLN